jgi:hypothetical protein
MPWQPVASPLPGESHRPPSPRRLLSWARTCTRITVTATLKLRTSSLRMFRKWRDTRRSIWSFSRPSGIWVPLQRFTSSKAVLWVFVCGDGGVGPTGKRWGEIRQAK